jgi:hypothetical protein
MPDEELTEPRPEVFDSAYLEKMLPKGKPMSDFFIVLAYAPQYGWVLKSEKLHRTQAQAREEAAALSAAWIERRIYKIPQEVIRG